MSIVDVSSLILKRKAVGQLTRSRYVPLFIVNDKMRNFYVFNCLGPKSCNSSWYFSVCLMPTSRQLPCWSRSVPCWVGYRLSKCSSWPSWRLWSSKLTSGSGSINSWLVYRNQFWHQISRSSIHWAGGRLTARSREISKPRDSGLDFSNRSEPRLVTWNQQFTLSAAYMRQWIGSAQIQIMACRLFGAKPLSKPMLGYHQMDPWQQT